MKTETEIRRRYQEALDSLTEKLKQDPYVIAAILWGSLSYDEVWEKSDIDLFIIGKDEKKPVKGFCLVENGINIHAVYYPRSKFKQALERGLQGSFMHSSFSRSTLLFSTDETIQEYYENVDRMGARDRELQLLRAGGTVLGELIKAEKWLRVKNDPAYCFLYLMYLLDGLATIEVVSHGEVAGREVIHQALRLNPGFFRAVYLDLIHGEKDAATLERTLKQIHDYLDDKLYLLFKPVLEYLADAGGARSTTDMDTYFKKIVQLDGLAPAYEWLADKGVIQKVSAPLRLTEKSPVALDEAAYYYDGGT